MNYNKIDIFSSIEQERIILSSSLSKLNTFVNRYMIVFVICILVLFITGMVTYEVVNFYNYTNHTLVTFLYCIFYLILVCLLLNYTRRQWKLKRIKGLTTNLNSNFFIDMANNLGWDIVVDNEKIIVLQVTMSLGGGHGYRDIQIMILYDGRDILYKIILNSTVGETPGDRKTEKIFLNYLKNKGEADK